MDELSRSCVQEGVVTRLQGSKHPCFIMVGIKVCCCKPDIAGSPLAGSSHDPSKSLENSDTSGMVKKTLADLD